MSALGAWMDANLVTQGYCLREDERRELGLGLRFSTGACLSLVAVALALESAPMIFVLSSIGVLAGFMARHPFDYVWNGGVRRLVGGAALPPNPPRRRHAFKIAAGWLAAVGVLFAAGATTAGLILGGLLVAACSLVTVFNLCLPSVAFQLLARRG